MSGLANVQLEESSASVERRRPSLFSRWMRHVRKHRLAFGSLAFFHLILFFPTLFMGRVLSPNDVFYAYDPWRSTASIEAQNPIINDPPASYLTLVSLLKDDPSAFHWNRFIASGVPGVGSIGAAVMSPFALVASLVPLLFFYSLFIVLKLNVGFVGAYLWLRHERMGKRAAAIGALVFAAAGTYAVWWLWQSTNVTTLLPFVLLVVRRMGDRRRLSRTMLSLLFVALLLSGFPAIVVYGVYAAAAYALFLMARQRRFFAWRSAATIGAAAVIALLITAPFVIPFVRFLRSTGYLEARATAGLLSVYPTSYLRLFVDPFLLGDPVSHRWQSQGGIAASDNLIESSLYLGLLTLPLIAFGVFNRRAKGRWFWFFALAMLLLLMFTTTPLSRVVGLLPGIRYSPLTRLRALMPLPAAFLAASGVALILRSEFVRRRGRKGLAAGVIACVVTYDLAFFAAHFYPYLEPKVATLPSTETGRFLTSQKAIARVAPLYDALWPNSSELLRFEDVRSHFSSEALYRRMLQRIDPGCWGGAGTVLMFDALRMNFDDPFFHYLGARYVVEQPSIDIVRWKIEDKTDRLDLSSRSLDLVGETLLEVQIRDRQTRAVMIPMQLVVPPGEAPRGGVRARVERPESGEIIGSAALSARQLLSAGKLFVPLRQQLDTDERVHLILEVDPASLVRVPLDGSGEIAHAAVHSSIIPRFVGSDGKIFENVAAAPRYFAVWDVRQASVEAQLSQRTDLQHVAFAGRSGGTDRQLASVPPEQRRVHFRIDHYDGAVTRLTTKSAVPFFLASSEKYSPDLQLLVDGKPSEVRRINLLFAGAAVPAGEHQITLQRRIGRGEWPLALCGLFLLLGAIVSDVRARR